MVFALHGLRTTAKAPEGELIALRSDMDSAEDHWMACLRKRMID
ncbi:hypothetical protein AB4Z29_09175 [Paenibacillus sp. 2TAB23]